MAESTDAPAEDTEASTTRTGHRRPQVDVAKTRTLIARVVWAVFVLLALVMALAALFIALKANPDNSFVMWIEERADDIDLHIFSLSDPIKNFDGKNGYIKEALLSYGLGAVAYLIVGRILDRIIRP